MLMMPPWPKERVTEALLFEYTGLDYFGPLYVKCYYHRLTANKLLKVWKYGQGNLNCFWRLWRTEYLLSLREQAQTQLKRHGKQASNIPRIGDVVLIKDNLPRRRWRIGS